MHYQLIQRIDDHFVTSDFTEEDFIPAMAARGYPVDHLNYNKRQRTELQGAPVFSKLIGPMWDGDRIRYEDRATNDTLSN